MASVYGQNIKISIFGQSHGAAIGVVIDGLPAGEKLDLDALDLFLSRRAPGNNSYSTQRKELDRPEILSGLVDGVTCGAPLAAVIRNTNTRSGDYADLMDVPRPAHADFTAHMKYHGANDIRGGGHFSGRLTAPLCIAGGICLQLLQREQIQVAAHIAALGTVADRRFDPAHITSDDLALLHGADFPVLDDAAGSAMRALIETARADGDSLGGIIECAAVGLPVGLGDPMFDGMESRIAAIVFGIPAVKGLDFGSGFDGARLRGSENNDSFYMDGDTVRTRTNNHGGILGGITSGMPLVFRAAVKPTPSIAKEQKSVSFSGKKDVTLSIHGRHDPTIVPRAVPVIEAAAAIAVLDAFIAFKGYQR
ncbi:chorismate synthase [Oscillospiraceae bacterium WX1]